MAAVSYSIGWFVDKISSHQILLGRTIAGFISISIKELTFQG